MDIWKHQMPKGMCLKLDGFASNLSDPQSAFTLQHYCESKGIPYQDQGLPVSLEAFTAYGLEFQKKMVPELEERMVVAVEPMELGFRLRLDDGETFTAGRVVVAVGITYFQRMPDVLAGLPDQFVTHSSKHTDLGGFKGRDVIILGAGSSAIDIAALLRRTGAKVRMITRGPALKFHVPFKTVFPNWFIPVLRPKTGLGPGWRSRFCTDAPLIFRLLPVNFRLFVVRRHLGPSPGWFIKASDLENVPVLTGTQIKNAEIRGGRVHLKLVQNDGAELDVDTDHLIAATGYKPDLRRLPFLDEKLLNRINSVQQTPVLSTNFESSVRGLYFIGLASANTFGPMLRFAYGAAYAARRLSRHLERSGCANAKRPDPGFALHRDLAPSRD
jgi:thioredoxin reductase